MQRDEDDLTVHDLVNDAIGVVYAHLNEVDAYQLSLTSRRFDLLGLEHFKIKLREYLAKYGFGKVDFDEAFNVLPLSYVARLVSLLKQPINTEAKKKKFLAWLMTENVRSVKSFAFWQLAITIVLRGAGCHYINSVSVKMFGSDAFNPESNYGQTGFSVSISNDNQVDYIKELIGAYKVSDSELIEDFFEQNLFARPDLQAIGWIYEYFLKRMVIDEDEQAINAEKIGSLLEPIINNLNLILSANKLAPNDQSADREQLAKEQLAARLKINFLNAMQTLSTSNAWLVIYFVARVTQSRPEKIEDVIYLTFMASIHGMSSGFIECRIREALCAIENNNEIIDIATMLAHPKVSDGTMDNHISKLLNIDSNIRDMLFVISNMDSFKLFMERIGKLFYPGINDNVELARLVHPHKVVHQVALLVYFAHNKVPYVHVKKITDFYIAAMNKILDIKKTKTNYLEKWENGLFRWINIIFPLEMGKSITNLFKFITLENNKQFNDINSSIFSSPLVVKTCMAEYFNRSRSMQIECQAYLENYIKLLEDFVGLNNLKQLTPKINDNLWRIAQITPYKSWRDVGLQAVIKSNQLSERSLAIYDDINLNVTFGGLEDDNIVSLRKRVAQRDISDVVATLKRLNILSSTPIDPVPPVASVSSNGLFGFKRAHEPDEASNEQRAGKRPRMQEGADVSSVASTNYEWEANESDVSNWLNSL